MKKIRLHPSGKELECGEEETVLMALEKNGYFLPNNCRAGACGECKTKVKSGEFDQGLVLDMALSRVDREKGFALMCMAKIKGQVLEIEWGEEDNRPKLFPVRENMPFILLEKVKVTPRIVQLRLRALGENLRFWPGQYITIKDRPYSLGNTPNAEGEIILYVTLVENGKTSTWIHQDLNEGDLVTLSGPYGTFIGDPSIDSPVLCLAAGSGLSPIISLASAALMRGGFKNSATVLFSARRKEDLFGDGIFSFLESKFKNFYFRHTLTKEKNSEDQGGRIPDILEKDFPNLSSYNIYISGGPDFVEACDNKVKELGGKEESIHKEAFFLTRTQN